MYQFTHSNHMFTSGITLKQSSASNILLLHIPIQTRRCLPARSQQQAGRTRRRARPCRTRNRPRPRPPRNLCFLPEEIFMNISAQSCASQPPQTPGDHRLCYTGQLMHSQPGKRLKSYHQTPTGTGRHPRPNRHHTFSLPAGTVYIQPWWSMTSMSQSLWTELSTVFRQCQKFRSERRTSARYSSNLVTTTRLWLCPTSSLRGNREDRTISWSWMTSYCVIT